MSRPNELSLPFSLLQFYATSPYACSYLQEEWARSQVATPTHLINTEIYGDLVRAGFRRSGVFIYRPWCDTCTRCVPVRLPVERFSPSRAQRRADSRHSTLRVMELPLLYCEEHYALYVRYQAKRHGENSVDLDSRDQYARFLLQSRIDTRLFEFREGDALRMVCLVDVLNDGLSSVYTFYDPDVPGASFGTYGILWQIRQCCLRQLPYLYLGYWIGASPKMAYKARYQPLEALVDTIWQPFPQTRKAPPAIA